MATDKNVTSSKTKSSSEVKPREVFLSPAVDIYEDNRSITVKADLPGVSKDRLDLKVSGNTLTLEGQTAIDIPKGMEALYADVRVQGYRRSFTLSNELDTANISAQMNDGVLTLSLPKRPELQPRKIEIRAA
ncbi:MAG: Hsp20/alpha crystallin family protein [Exilibacterium sp.]|jgi:HSP20 family molecular chaperone IbpA